MSVSLQIRKYLDNIAKTRQVKQEALASRVRLWTIQDGGADEDFENTVGVDDLSTADDCIENASDFRDQKVGKAITLLNDYFRDHCSLTNPLMASYLASVGYRIPWETNEAHYEAVGTRVSSHLVFPKGTGVADEADPSTAGLHKFGTWSGGSTWTDVDGALDMTKIIGAPIVAVSREATPGDTNAVMRCYIQQSTATPNYKDIAVVPSATLQAQVVVGKQAITGVTGAVISVGATTQFLAGEYVLLFENADGDTSLREVGKIKTGGVVLNTSIELEAAPVNTFTAAGFVLPIFISCARQSGTLTGGKHVDFYAYWDRIISMTAS